MSTPLTSETSATQPNLNRRDTRYWFFRLKQEADGGVDADAPEGFRAYWEEFPYFGGWDSFGVTWDLAPDSTDQIVPLRYSLEADWNATAWASAREAPGQE